MYQRSKVTMYPQKTKISIPRKRVNLNQKDAKRNPFVEHLNSEYPDKVNGKFSKENHDTRIRKRLEDFDAAKAKPTKKIVEICENKLNKEKAIKIAWAISNKLKIWLDRDAYRELKVLFKWFDENWKQISQIIDNVKLDENGNVQISEPELVPDFDPFQNNDWTSPYENNDNNDYSFC